MSAHDESYYDEMLACIDGTLDAEGVARLEQRLAESQELRAEYEWLKTASEDLAAMGCAMARRVPNVDLVDSVMGAVSGTATPYPSRDADARRAWWGTRRAAWFGLAAAAVLALAFGLARTLMTTGGSAGPRQLAGPAASKGEEPLAPVLDPVDARYDAIKQQLPGTFVADARPPESFEEVGAPDTPALTPGEIIETRRHASSDESAWRSIKQWASITPSKAREILASPMSPPEAIVAAAQSLSPSEREIALVTAVGQLPNQPAARLTLARSYYAQPKNADAALSQLEALRAQDPENALPYYLEAKLRLDRGDVEGALSALDQARGLDSASSYALQSARYHEEALLAGGMDAQSARLLSALTGGNEQYNFLCDLAEDLLQYGRNFSESGDARTAEQVFQAVQRLGQQLNGGASFVLERLAGLDIERTAIDLLGQLYQAIGSAEGLNALATQALELVGGLEGIKGFADVIERFFQGTGSADLWMNLANTFLENGSVPVLDMFTSGRLDMPRFLQGIALQPAAAGSPAQ